MNSSCWRLRISQRDEPRSGMWEGRNAVWLAERGWKVTGVDFSPVGLAKAQRLAEARQVDVRWVESAVEEWTARQTGSIS